MMGNERPYIEYGKGIWSMTDFDLVEGGQPGDILIGNRLLINSALLLDKKIRLDEGRLLDFCTLVNAITLYDRLVTLHAVLPIELTESTLYKFLVKERILYMYNSSMMRETREELEDFFGAKVSDEEVEKSKWIHFHMRWENDYYDEHHKNDINSPREKFIQKVIMSKRSTSSYLAWNDQTYKNIVGEDYISPFRIRTAAYWLIPGILPISFLPDFIRIPLITKYNTRLKQMMRESIKTQSVRLFIEKKVQDDFRSELKKLWPFANPKPIPIPNAALTFLDNYSSSSSLEETFRSLRQGFQSNKKQIVKWESILRDADKTGYGKALKTLDEMSASLESGEKTDRLHSVFSIGMGAIRDLLGFSPGINSAEAALPEISDIIKKSMQRKKISYVYSGIKQQYDVKNRSDLLEKTFGSTLTNDQRYNFFILTEYLDNLITEPIPESLT